MKEHVHDCNPFNITPFVDNQGMCLKQLNESTGVARKLVLAARAGSATRTSGSGSCSGPAAEAGCSLGKEGRRIRGRRRRWQGGTTATVLLAAALIFRLIDFVLASSDVSSHVLYEWISLEKRGWMGGCYSGERHQYGVFWLSENSVVWPRKDIVPRMLGFCFFSQDVLVPRLFVFSPNPLKTGSKGDGVIGFCEIWTSYVYFDHSDRLVDSWPWGEKIYIFCHIYSIDRSLVSFFCLFFILFGARSVFFHSNFYT